MNENIPNNLPNELHDMVRVSCEELSCIPNPNNDAHWQTHAEHEAKRGQQWQPPQGPARISGVWWV